MIYKHKGLNEAEYIIGEAVKQIDNYKYESGIELSGWIEAFNNCREQGYSMCLYPSFDCKYSENNYLTIYVYCNRNSDKPSITWEPCFSYQMYSEDAYYNRTQTFDSLEETLNRVMELVKENFSKTLDKEQKI